MTKTLKFGRWTLIIGYARQTWTGGRIVRSSYRGTSCLMIRLLGFYAVLTCVPNPLRLTPGRNPRTLFEIHPDPEQHGG